MSSLRPIQRRATAEHERLGRMVLEECEWVPSRDEYRVLVLCPKHDLWYQGFLKRVLIERYQGTRGLFQDQLEQYVFTVAKYELLATLNKKEKSMKHYVIKRAGLETLSTASYVPDYGAPYIQPFGPTYYSPSARGGWSPRLDRAARFASSTEALTALQRNAYTTGDIATVQIMCVTQEPVTTYKTVETAVA